MSDYHAIASPSSAEKWLACANSLAAELGQPDTAGAAADLGTDKHELLTMCLAGDGDTSLYLGLPMPKGNVVDEAFAADVQNVVDNVRARIQNYENLGYRVEMDLEQDVPIGHITGEKGATGRADVVLRVYVPNGHHFIDVIDAKFGYSEVSAEGNPQLKMYAAGVIEKYALTDEFDQVQLVIEQPARSKESIESGGFLVSDLLLWVEEVAAPAARKALANRDRKAEGGEILFSEFGVTEKGCQWCKAAAVCPARVAHVEEAIGADFETVSEHLDSEDEAHALAELIPVEELASKFEALEIIEDWIKAVRARIEFELLAGKKIPGVKLVAGKKGNRQWASDEEAEAMLKKFRVKEVQMYSFKLLGPKPILEVMKDRPRQLKHIEALIVQPNGKPHVALDSDKRPALEIKPVEDGFDTEELC
jgi:hypothetical protein